MPDFAEMEVKLHPAFSGLEHNVFLTAVMHVWHVTYY